MDSVSTAKSTADRAPQRAIENDGVAGASIEWDLRGMESAAPLWALLPGLASDDVVVGIGGPLLDAMRATVDGYRPFKRFTAGRYTMPSTQHALWTFISGRNASEVFEVAERLKRVLAPWLNVAQSTTLFSYRQGRDLSGYKDGTANPAGEAVHAAAYIPQGPWAAGSFALVQRWLHFRERFGSLSPQARDHVVGRSLDADEELADAPASAHVRRTEQESFSPSGLMYRRSMPWGDARRHGLQFIAFVNDIGKAERMLERMSGSHDGIADAILGHTQAETGAFYFVPPVADGTLLLPPALGPVSRAAPDVDGIHAAEAHGIRLEVDVARCIHSRNCVLARPDVFVPNVDGPWLHPELATPGEIIEIAHNCPSGAITYSRGDGGPNEKPPMRNVIRLREAGPLAIHGDFVVGSRSEIRATLCRCGQSRNKPYCDGSHAAAGFSASGEARPLMEDDPGPMPRRIVIEPVADGPLVVHGAVDIVSGTGRTISRAAGPTLCRCGQSGNKPFCDGSHARVGFNAKD